MKKYVGTKVLTETLAKNTGITKKEAEERIAEVVKLFREVLLDDSNDGIQFIDFLTLEKVVRAERLGRNPRTKEPITIPSKLSVKAKLGTSFDAQLNNR